MGTSHNALGGNKEIIYSALVAGLQISSEEQFYFRTGHGSAMADLPWALNLLSAQSSHSCVLPRNS